MMELTINKHTNDIMLNEYDQRVLPWLEVNKKPPQIEARHIKSYTVYSNDGFILERYERESNQFDTPVQYSHDGISVLPKFNGEWRKLSDEEISALNKQIIEKLKKTRRVSPIVTIDEEKVDEAITDKETRKKIALQEAIALLQKKIKEKEEKERDRDK